jgi:hypothetical protein
MQIFIETRYYLFTFQEVLTDPKFCKGSKIYLYRQLICCLQNFGSGKTKQTKNSWLHRNVPKQIADEMSYRKNPANTLQNLIYLSLFL